MKTTIKTTDKREKCSKLKFIGDLSNDVFVDKWRARDTLEFDTIH